MRAILGWLLPAVMLPLTVYAQEATVKEIHDAPAVRGSIIANMLQEHDNPFTLYPYDTNYLIYTNTSDMNKEAISSYSWSENARKDEVKFQLSSAFPLWRGILGPKTRAWWFLYPEIPGGSFLIAKNRHRFAKLTTNHNCSSVSPPITALPAGRYVMWKWDTTTTLTVVPNRPRAAGTACMPA